MPPDGITLTDKFVKVGLGVTKLILGKSRLDALGEIVEVVTNGRDLLADLRPDEEDIGRRLRAASEAQLNRHDVASEYPEEVLHDARAHMAEALDHCVPDQAALVALDLDAERITEAIIATALARAPRAEFAIAWEAPGSASLHYFRTVCVGFFGDLLKDEEVIHKLLPVLWSDLLKTVHGIDETTRRTEGKLDGVAYEMAKIKALLMAQTRGERERERLEAEVAELNRRHSENGAAVVNLLRLLLDRRIAPDQWHAALAAAEEQARKLLADDYRLPNEASEQKRELIGEARRALQRFDFSRAEELRVQVRELGRRRRGDAQEMMAAQDAEETAEIAATVAAGLEYVRAADLYREAAETPHLAINLQWKWQIRRADTLQHHGREFGDNAALTQAIRLYRDVVLPLAPRTERPEQWAGTQNNLGIALAELGRRESGTDWLVQAVAAHRAALEELRQDRAPLHWAMTQNNLGNALATLSNRGGGTAQLQEAIAAYQAALEERRRDLVPLDWAQTQNNLGTALRTLGECEGSTARLEKAVAALRLALEVRSRERRGLEWATMQRNLGSALRALGEREGGTASLEEAVAAHRAALEEATRERVPLSWAETQNGLGNALRALGEREGGTARLEEAVAAYRTALQELTRGLMPLRWAETQYNLGLALWRLGTREWGTQRLEEAIAAYRSALEERTRECVPQHWAATQNNLGLALTTLGKRVDGTARLEEGVAAYRAALQERTRAGVPNKWASTMLNLGIVETALFDKTACSSYLDRAEEHIRAALEVFRDADGQYFVMAEEKLRQIGERRASENG